jgi:2-hydroxy-3-oxopropionate reductase
MTDNPDVTETNAAVKPTVGFIGLGLMGRPMALNLLEAGYPLVVHSRSAPPVNELVAGGAQRVRSPREIAERTTRIVTMVPDSPDVEGILRGREGIFAALQPGTIIIDCSSISPDVARNLAREAAERGAQMLDAPVSGGEIGAVSGTLSIMVGGDARAFAEVKPILDVMGNPEKVIRIGDSGAGQITKVCNQMVIGGTLAVVSEAFALAKKSGVDPTKVREALLGGFAASRVLEVHGERILTENYKPGFRSRLYAKDMRIAAQTLAATATPAPVSSVVQDLVHGLVARGRGDLDYSALATVLFDLADISHGADA